MTYQIAEAVSPAHPDKIADQIAGALVDYAYAHQDNPRVAFEVLIGHGNLFVTGETSLHITTQTVTRIAKKILCDNDPTFDGNIKTHYVEVPQDTHLANNEKSKLRVADNGIFYGHFNGFSTIDAHIIAKKIAESMYEEWPVDGKLVIESVPHKEKWQVLVNWSNVERKKILKYLGDKFQNCEFEANALGDWSGGVSVDTGLTGRKLANDFYGLRAPLGGGNMHGKDLTKGDVSINIECYLMANEYLEDIYAEVAIGDDTVEFRKLDGRAKRLPFDKVVEDARDFIRKRGGFQEFAKWGLIK